MSDSSRSLADIRSEIDLIDAQLRDLMLRRLALMDEVSTAKSREGGGAVRPSREAQLLRALIADRDSGVPPAALIRIWREIINCGTALQGPLSVAVCAPQKSVGYWDMARNQFGTDTAMTLHNSPMDVLRRLGEEQGVIGLLPLPQEGDSDSWWPGLASEAARDSGPKIIWRLPFYVSERGRFEELAAFALANVTPEPSGADATVAVVVTDLDTSRGRILSAFEALGLEAQMLAIVQDDIAERRSHLIEIAGFLAGDDERLQKFSEKIGDSIEQIAILGAYPLPIDQAA